MLQYTAFGLTFESDLELSPMILSNALQADVNIITGVVSKSGLTTPAKVKPYTQCSVNEFWLHVPDIAWFYVANGNHITVEPEINADMKSVKLFLLGSCMGALMYQRNRLVIHGNAIRFGDECLVFAGHSGNGKSTLAAAFHQRGYNILTDDLSVIDEQGEVQPSYPQLKLWHDTAKKLNIDVSGLNRIRLHVDKYAYPITASFCERPLPIKALYILETHNKNNFVIESIEGMNKFTELTAQSYRQGYLDGLGLKAQHLQLCAKNANKIQIKRVTRPNNNFRLDELVELIETDIKQREGILA